jgi:hypothetical protein
MVAMSISPTIIAPSTLTFLPAGPDDGVPVAVRLFLIVRRDLGRKCLAVWKLRPAVEKGRRSHQGTGCASTHSSTGSRPAA